MYSPRQVLARSVRVSVPDPLMAAPTEVDLARAERAMGRHLPESFLDFQRVMGGRGLSGVTVLRLASHADDAANLIEVNLRWRSPRHGCGLPADVVAFAADGAGDLFCFDLRTNAAEPPVVLWDPTLDPESNLTDLRPQFSSFIEWLEAELDLTAAA
jgi:hypothetical protein